MSAVEGRSREEREEGVVRPPSEGVGVHEGRSLGGLELVETTVLLISLQLLQAMRASTLCTAQVLIAIEIIPAPTATCHVTLGEKIPIIARLRPSESGRLPEAASDPPALASMTDSSEEEEENEEDLFCGSADARKSEKYAANSNNLPGKTRGRFLRMAFMKNRGVWFVWDPCGIVCAVMTYMLVLYGEFVMLTVIAPPFPGAWTVLMVLGFSALGGLAVVAHVRSMFTDPVSVLCMSIENEVFAYNLRKKGVI